MSDQQLHIIEEDELLYLSRDAKISLELLKEKTAEYDFFEDKIFPFINLSYFSPSVKKQMNQFIEATELKKIFSQTSSSNKFVKMNKRFYQQLLGSHDLEILWPALNLIRKRIPDYCRFSTLEAFFSNAFFIKETPVSFLIKFASEETIRSPKVINWPAIQIYLRDCTFNILGKQLFFIEIKSFLQKFAERKRNYFLKSLGDFIILPKGTILKTVRIDNASNLIVKCFFPKKSKVLFKNNTSLYIHKSDHPNLYIDFEISRIIQHV